MLKSKEIYTAELIIDSCGVFNNARESVILNKIVV